MTIGIIIKQLLEERQRVILPGFGNLEVKESSGSFPTSGKRIDPPGLTIKFDASYSKDDELLSTTMARELQIGTEEARQKVLELVDAIKFALDKGEPYSLAEAGIFSRDEDGKVHFRQEPGWVLEPEQYGLESMDLLELEEEPDEKPRAVPKKPEEKRVSTDKKETAPAQKKPAPKEAAPAQKKAAPKDAAPKEAAPKEPAPKEAAPKEAAPKAPVQKEPARARVMAGSKPAAMVHEPWKREEPRRRHSRWRVIWIVAGALIVVLVALIIIPADRLNLFGDRDGTEQPTPAEVEVPVTGAETDDPAISDESPADESEEPAIVETEQTPVEETVEMNNYFIIAGSFKHLGNASELQDGFKVKGYQAEVMVTENRMYRVSLASFATKREAEIELARIKSEPGLESCWLLSNE